jgi:hypothetical protein
VQQNHGLQLDPLVATSVVIVVLTGDDLVGEHMGGLSSGVGLSRLEEAEYLVPAAEDPAVCLELGVGGERADPGGGPATVDVAVVADDQSPTVAHSIASISRRHHDVLLSLELGSA